MGKLIVIEALDAGGSQTQTDALVRKLKREKFKTLQLHFPQEDRATGQFIYHKFLLSKNKLKFSRREQALLYIQDFLSRAEDLAAIKSQSAKHIAVSDRYASSTMAYQTIGLSGARRRQLINQISWLCFQGTPSLPKPDLTIFLDTPVEISLKHLSRKKKDFFETKAKLTAIRNSYLKLAQEQKWAIINSVNDRGEQRTIQDIHSEVWEIVQSVL